MSQLPQKINIEDTIHEERTEIIKPRKHKHNSKRRKTKRSLDIIEIVDNPSTSQKEKLNYLCNVISKNESETSVETNPPVKVLKESANNNNGRKYDTCLCTRPGCHEYSSCPVPKLNQLFLNLHMNTMSSIPEFPNKNVLMTSNHKMQFQGIQTQSLNASNNMDWSAQSNSRQKSSQYSLIAGTTSFVNNVSPDYSHAIYYTLTENNCQAQVNLSKNPNSNLVQNTFSLTNNLENKVILNDVLEKNKKQGKRGQFENFGMSGSGQKGSKSVIQHFQDIQKPSTSNTPNSKKKLQCSNNLKSGANGDSKFPKYLSPEELQSISTYGVLLSGIIRINQKNYREAYITAPDKGMDILIDGLRDRNRALEGDEVYILMKFKEHQRTGTENSDTLRTAVVVGIKKINHSRGAIGTLNPVKNSNLEFAIFSPRDMRLPRIRIRKSNWPAGFAKNSESFKDILYFAKILQWNDMKYADGELVKEIGQVGDIDAETRAILLKYDLDVSPYNDSVKQYLPPKYFKISEAEIKNREDLRKECVFTIDPETAIDLDDAVSCRQLPNGNYEVGVHIADVSYFLKEGTPLDNAVSRRATTIYLVQQVHHMLPFELCQLCSLTPGEDKLSFSVLWEVTPDYRITKHRFARTIINSCAKFSYQQVQNILEKSSDVVFPKIHGQHSIENIKNRILFLHQMAVLLGEKRYRDGALRIQKKKIYFLLDEHFSPQYFKAEVHDESHRLIEELMLLANMTVAEKLVTDFPTIAFLRAHSPPLNSILEKLQKSLTKLGISLDISTAGGIHASVMKYSGGDRESIAHSLVLSYLIAKNMTRANYYCAALFPAPEDKHHYALNVPLYTHFTSPIRRYADIMVHRLLEAASLNHCLPHWSVDYVQSIASNCNKQKYSAKLANEASIELYFSIYVGLKGVFVCEAVVCDIKDRSFDCIVLSTGTHQRVYFERIKGELFQSKENEIQQLAVKWPVDDVNKTETVQLIKIFSIVKIELKRTSALKVEATLLRTE